MGLLHRVRCRLTGKYVKNGQAAEVGTVGNEGVVGLPLLFGDNKAPTTLYVQVPGAGLRIQATLFNKQMAQSASICAVMLRYAHAFFTGGTISRLQPLSYA